MDPSIILFSHSKICPVFSGCNKPLKNTLKEIKDGVLKIGSLPTITIIKNNNDAYISLNNRRLWILKECKILGLLDVIKVNIKDFSKLSKREQYRYNNNTYSAEAKLNKNLIRNFYNTKHTPVPR